MCEIHASEQTIQRFMAAMARAKEAKAAMARIGWCMALGAGLGGGVATLVTAAFGPLAPYLVSVALSVLAGVSIHIIDARDWDKRYGFRRHD